MRPLHTSGRQSKYAILASELARLPIEFPGFQRELAEEHVQQMIAHQREMFSKFKYYLFLGTLEFARYNGILYCIDGQHRYHAMCELVRADPLSDFEIVIEIIEAMCLDEAEELFQLVNKTRPLPSFLLKEEDHMEVTVAVKTSKMGARELRDYMKKTYKAFLSTSDKPQRPNVNLDKFVEAIEQRYPTECAGNVIEWFQRMNEVHHEYLEDNRANEPFDKCLSAIAKKDGTAPLYLGCYWLDPLPNKIPAPLRTKVWKTWYSSQPAEAKMPSGEILCPCCKSSMIEQSHFHAGHRISHKNGGALSAENLIPLCGQCNMSMGRMNYDEFLATKMLSL